MEKCLILFRHGKSDWNAEFLTDHERPIAKRGIKAAKVMGKLLQAAGQVPDSVISSSAVRARTTVELAAEAGSWNCPIRVTSALYEADPLQVMGVIHQEPDTTATLLLVGHEPTWSELTAKLIGGGRVRVATAAMVQIGFEVDSWSKVEFGLGELVGLISPKFFTEGGFEVLLE